MKPKYKLHTLAPFCNSNLSLNQTLLVYLIVVIPYIIILAIGSNALSLQLLLIVVLTSVCAELTHCLLHKKTVSFSLSIILQGIIIGLLVPEEYNLILAALIPFFVLFFERMIYNSFAQAWVNPIVLTLVIMYFAYPSAFPDFLLSPESVQHQNIATKLVSDGLIQVDRLDTRLTTLLNSAFFNNVGISVPEGYFTLLADSQSTIPAFRFNIITIIASIILIITKSIDYVLPIVFLVAYSFCVYAFSLYPYAGLLGDGDILLALFTGGTLFSAFFLIGWFGTTPLTIGGKISYGVISGILTFLICGAGTSSIGILFVLLIVNLISPVILHLESKIYTKNLKKKLDLLQVQRI